MLTTEKGTEVMRMDLAVSRDGFFCLGAGMAEMMESDVYLGLLSNS